MFKAQDIKFKVEGSEDEKLLTFELDHASILRRNRKKQGGMKEWMQN